MSQGRTSVSCVLIVVSMILTMPAVDAQTSDAAEQKPDAANEKPPATVCRPPDQIDTDEALVKGGYIGDDRKLHFTFGIEPGADPAQEKAFREAVRRWNKRSNTTRMVLEEASPDASDIKFGKGQMDYDKHKNPISYGAKHDPNDSSVRYCAKNMTFAAKKPGLAAKIYVHEIGHVFGMNHPKDPDSLMDEREYRASKDYEEGARKLKDLGSSDARAALLCAFAIRYRHGRSASPP